MSIHRLPTTVVLGVAIVIAGCSGSGGATLAASTPAVTSGSTAPVSAPSASSPAPSATSPAGRVSANTATSAELVAALTTAGVPNPERWAREIQEYRPYDVSDVTLQKLQDNLAKYGPSPETLSSILSALQP